MRHNYKAPLVGKRFGRWTVMDKPTLKNKHGLACWSCKCDCGTERWVNCQGLFDTSGHITSRSCGCLKNEQTGNRRRTHGASRDRKNWPEYTAWQLMRQRCNNPNHPRFKDWGGRGIKVAEEFSTFEGFINCVGRKPSPKHSLDRFPDPDGDYKPGNVRWATALQQRHNRRKR